MPFAVINPFFQFFDNVGEPLDGGTVETYESGTSTPKVTYQDATLTTPNTTTITLNSAGRCSMFVGDGETFKYILKDSSGVTIETKDGVKSPYGTQAGIGELLYPQTAGEVAAGVTPQVYSYPPGHVLRHIPSAQHADILAGTSTYDASGDLQDWLDSLTIGSIATIVGEVRGQGLTLNTSDVHFAGDGWIAPVSDAAEAILEIGTGTGSSQPDLVYRITGHIKVGHRAATTEYESLQGLVIRNAYLFDLAVDARNVIEGLCLLPDSSQRVAYSDFHLGQFVYSDKGVYIAPSGAGFANSNRFYGGQFRSAVGVYIANSNSPPNHNVFYSPVFEGGGKSIFCDGTSNAFIEARFEPNAAPGDGIFFELGSNSTRNLIDLRYSNNWTGHSLTSIDHGAGTRTSDNTFTIAGDVTPYMPAGAPIGIAVGGNGYETFVRTSSYSSPNTTIRVVTPIITGNPTAVRTCRYTDLGSLNCLRADIGTISAISRVANIDMRKRQRIALMESAMVISSLGADYPALTLQADTSNANDVLRIMDLATGRVAYMRGDGRLSVPGFNLGGTPVAQQATISDPTGGATVDAEARTAINTLIDRLQAFGFIA